MNSIAQLLPAPLPASLCGIGTLHKRKNWMISLTTHNTISNGELTVLDINEHCVAGSIQKQILLVAPHFFWVKGQEGKKNLYINNFNWEL